MTNGNSLCQNGLNYVNLPYAETVTLNDYETSYLTLPNYYNNIYPQYTQQCTENYRIREKTLVNAPLPQPTWDAQQGYCIPNEGNLK